jgi:hypothetical protein
LCWHSHDLAAEPPQLSVALLPLALLVRRWAFLPFNFAPARSLWAAAAPTFWALSVAALGHHRRGAAGDCDVGGGLPALDVAWLIFSRRWRRACTFAHIKVGATICTFA